MHKFDPLKMSDTNTRYFKNPILEKLAYTSHITVYLIFIPLVLIFFYFSINKHSFFINLIGIISGVLIWTLVEYWVHRYAFHFKFQHKKIKWLHAIFHFSHHDYPNDQRKYQTILMLSIPSGCLFYFILKSLVGIYIEPVFTGFILGYVIYEFAHYSSHKFKMDFKPFKALKQHHMHHHFLHPEKNFGVTSVFWDKVFRTQLSEKEKLKILQKKVKKTTIP